MDRAAWIGLALGAVIGAICGFWHAWDMRAGASAMPGWRRVGSGAARLLFLLVALLAAVVVAGANKFWLVGSVAVIYTAVFVWKFRQALAKKK
jgi:hypothetical protein